MKKFQVVTSKVFIGKDVVLLLVVATIIVFLIPNSGLSQTSVCNDGICSQGETQQGCPSDCPESLTFLSTNGQRIVNEKGHYVDLRGFHFDCFSFLGCEHYFRAKSEGDNPAQFNAELSGYFCADEDIKTIKEMGANVVKIGFKWWDIKDDIDGPNQTALAHLDNLIDRFGRNGIYVIPSLSFARQNSLASLEKPDDPGLWEESAAGTAFREWILNIWETIAARYKDNPYIAGYNILKEPGPPTPESLHSFYEQAIQRIRAKDPRHIVFLEVGLHQEDTVILWGGDYDYGNIVFGGREGKMEQAPDPPTILGMLDPDPNNSYHKYAYESIRSRFQIFLDASEVQGRPIFVGDLYFHAWDDQIRAEYTDVGGLWNLIWLNYCGYIFKELHVPYTFFCYKSCNPFYGHCECMGWSDPTSCFEWNNAYYRPNEETFQEIERLVGDLVNGGLRLSQVDETRKALFLTKNFDRAPNIEAVLTEAFRGAVSENQTCEPGESTFEITLDPGWSMISLPVDPSDKRLTALFPDAVVMYRYKKGTGYVRVTPDEELGVGKGYWILLDEEKTYTLCGKLFNSYTIPEAQKGWSMIGGCSYSALPSVDRGTISSVFGFTDGYELMGLGDCIKPFQPGCGYWIYLSDEAVLRLGETSLHSFEVIELTPPFESHGDLWLSTWADDDSLFVSWGDGLGPHLSSPSHHGLAKLTGSFPDVNAEVIKQYMPLSSDSYNSKPSSLLFLDGRLYVAFHYPLMDPTNGCIAYSDDYGATFQFIQNTPRNRNENYRFICLQFINMGKNYELNTDGYVYAFGTDAEVHSSPGYVPRAMWVYLTRMPKHGILNYSSWEYYTGTDHRGNAMWSANWQDAAPIDGLSYTKDGLRPGTTYPNFEMLFSAMYHPGLDRYIALTATVAQGEVFVSPNPWGPWSSLGQWFDQDSSWYPAYMPGLITKDAGPNSVYFSVSGMVGWTHIIENEAAKYRYRLGKIVFDTK